MQLFLLLIGLLSGVIGAFSGNTGGLLVAAGCIFLATSGLARRAPGDEEDRLARRLDRLAGEPWFLALAVALLLAGSAALLARQDPHNRYVIYLWLAGLVLVVLGGWLHDRAARLANPAVRRAGIDWDRLDWVSVGLLAALALALRLYRLNDFLPAMSGDEGEMGLLALHALWGAGGPASPRPLPYFSTAFLDHPTLFHYVQAGAMWLFGETLTGLRLLSVLVGTLCVPLLYVVARLGWGRAAALTAGWLMTVSHLSIHYSRIALNNIESVWFMVALVLLFFWVYHQHGSDEAGLHAPTPAASPQPFILPSVLIGLVIALSQYFYYGSRLLPVVAVVALFYLWRARRIVLVQLLVIVVAGVVAIGPLALHYTKNTAGFVNRMRGVSVFSQEGLAHTLGPDASWPADLPRLFWFQLARNAEFFVDGGDRSSFYLADLPVFDPVTVLLFWVGLGLAIARIRQFQEWVLINWLVLGTLLAGVLTTDAPNGPRLLLVLPAAYMVAGLTVQRFFDFSARHDLVTLRKGVAWLGAGVAVALALFHVRAYFVTYAHFAAQSVPINIAHNMAATSEDYRSYLFGAPNLFADYGVMRFVAREADRNDAVELADLPLPLSGVDAGKGLLIIALSHQLNTLDEIERRYPNGIRQVYYNGDGNPTYATYRLDPDVLANQSAATSTR
jgi:4-amino-4-deoxy-L-arabinose transferase-like glycosyltransferase